MFSDFVCKLDDCGEVFPFAKALDKHKFASHGKKNNAFHYRAESMGLVNCDKY